MPAHTHGNEAELTREVLARSESVLVVWHHGTMLKIVRHLPIVSRDDAPKHWPDERFDLIPVLVRQPGAELGYRFVSVPQMLLADDAATGWARRPVTIRPASVADESRDPSTGTQSSRV